MSSASRRGRAPRPVRWPAPGSATSAVRRARPWPMPWSGSSSSASSTATRSARWLPSSRHTSTGWRPRSRGTRISWPRPGSSGVSSTSAASCVTSGRRRARRGAVEPPDRRFAPLTGDTCRCPAIFCEKRGDRPPDNPGGDLMCARMKMCDEIRRTASRARWPNDPVTRLVTWARDPRRSNRHRVNRRPFPGP
jgi:hypothetical protein